MDVNECESTEEEVSNNHIIVCAICKRTFVSRLFKTRHVCKGPLQRNDLITASLRYSCELLNKGVIDFIDTQNIDNTASAITDERQALISEKWSGYDPIRFDNGWAKRPNYG